MTRAGFLTLDLGTDTGWCREVVGGKPLFGTWNLRAPSKHPGATYCNLTDYLADELELRPPEKIVYEAPFLMIPKDEDGKARGNSATLQRLIGFTIPVLQLSYRFSIPVFPVAVQSARAAFLHGRAQKPEIFDECIRRGWYPKNEHESDAGCLLDYTFQLFHIEEWARTYPAVAAQHALRKKKRR